MAGKQIDYFDSHTRGLSLRISPSGTKTWMLIYRAQTAAGPKLRRLSLGRYPALSLADARAEATRRQAGIMRDGTDPAAEKKKVDQVITVLDMAEVYLAKHARINKRSWRKDEAILQQDILPIIGKLSPREVERAHIEKILDRVAARGTTTQQNRVFEIVRGLFNWATGLYVDVPPTFRMKKR
ncbi:MAG: integrase arm-type DNA-binding domain-containing protein, partial [Geminicoccaceae bacterium]